MKKRVLSILTVCVLCLSIVGCSKPTGTSATQENAVNTALQSSYAALRCDEQNFSVLHRSGYSGVSRSNGVSIYPESDVERNRVDVSVIHEGDTAGWDAGNYFFFRAEEMGNQDGNQYTLTEEYQQNSFGTSTMHGAVYSYDSEDGTICRYEMVVDTGSQLISYSCYFYEGEQDEPIRAMTDAIKSYQPSAAYYDTHPLVMPEIGAPEPQLPQSTASQQPQQPQSPASAASFRLEAVQPIISGTSVYNDGRFSIELPDGWQIVTAGEYTTFNFCAYDPQKPERKIFYYCKLDPFLKSAAAKNAMRSKANMVGPNDSFGYNAVAAVPVLDPPTFSNFLSAYNDYVPVTTQYPNLFVQCSYPDLHDIQVLETYANSTLASPSCHDNSIARILFVSDNNIACQGLVAGQVTEQLVSIDPMTNIDVGFHCVYCFNGITAPADEFAEMEAVLQKCISTFTFTQAYLDETGRAVKQRTDAILAQARSMQATYDSYNAAWSARQTSYDIISQKNSDATLGYDRLYDPDTGEVYRAELGFYDSYNTNREQYQNPNLQIIDGSTEDYYLSGVDYYIYK